MNRLEAKNRFLSELIASQNQKKQIVEAREKQSQEILKIFQEIFSATNFTHRIVCSETKYTVVFQPDFRYETVQKYASRLVQHGIEAACTPYLDIKEAHERPALSMHEDGDILLAKLNTLLKIKDNSPDFNQQVFNTPPQKESIQARLLKIRNAKLLALAP